MFHVEQDEGRIREIAVRVFGERLGLALNTCLHHLPHPNFNF